MMPTTVTSKGQVTIPKKLRDHLGLQPGSAVDFEQLPSGEVVLRAVDRVRRRKASAFAKVRGSATVKMTTDEIMALTRGD